MKQKRKKVAYQQESKRNVMKDILTDAGRRARNRASEKESERRLREVLESPTDAKGKPVATHLLKQIAAERLATVAGCSPFGDFDYASRIFFEKLRYQQGHAIPVSRLWTTFLNLVTNEDAESAMAFAKNYISAFRWCLAGHIHRLELEYYQQPTAIVTVEIYRYKRGCLSVALLRDGSRRVIPDDEPVEHPMMLFAGTKARAFIAQKDLRALAEMVRSVRSPPSSQENSSSHLVPSNS